MSQLGKINNNEDILANYHGLVWNLRLLLYIEDRRGSESMLRILSCSFIFFILWLLT